MTGEVEHGESVDVAMLLLRLADGQPVVSRAALTEAWRQHAKDLDTSEHGKQFALERRRGSYATHQLHGRLKELEDAGLVRRVGEPPRHGVQILDLDGLRALVADWDQREEME